RRDDAPGPRERARGPPEVVAAPGRNGSGPPVLPPALPEGHQGLGARARQGGGASPPGGRSPAPRVRALSHDRPQRLSTGAGARDDPRPRSDALLQGSAPAERPRGEGTGESRPAEIGPRR